MNGRSLLLVHLPLQVCAKNAEHFIVFPCIVATSHFPQSTV
jgi:hypothetical protein